MIGLRELRIPAATSWDKAGECRLPEITHYSIADDCLRGDPAHAAIVEVSDGEVVTLTYAKLDARSARFANFLVEAGLEPGDRVGIKLSQSIDMAVVVLGVLRAHGVVVPLSNVLAPGALHHRLDDSEPRFLVALGSADERALLTGRSTSLIPVEPGAPGETSLVSIVASGPTTYEPRTPGRADEHAIILYTSGTTGKPKGVLHGHRFLIGHHAIDFAWDGVRPNDVAYSPVDWTWAGGLMLGLLVPLAYGVTVVAHREQRFDAARCVDVMRRTRVSIGLLPPTVLRMLRAAEVLDAATVGASDLRCFITGAEAVEPELIEWTESIGLSVNNAYGQTEANSLVGHAATLGRLDLATMGRPYPRHEIAVLNDDLEPCEPGVPGQLAVRADDLVCMIGYWRAPQATEQKVRKGWLLTGDTAHVNNDGTLSFHGRSDDIIKSGAYRLGPAEIEAAVLRLAAVKECVAVGVPDPIRGQIVAAVVVLRPGESPTDELTAEIRESVREGVGAHAYPREVRYVDALPRTTTGKVDRATIRRSVSAPGMSAFIERETART